MDAKDFVFNKSKTNCTRPSVHYNKQVCPRLEVHHFNFFALVFVNYNEKIRSKLFYLRQANCQHVVLVNEFFFKL